MNPVMTKETKRLADASFTAVEFEGVPVTFDESCSAGSMYFINVDNFKLGIMNGADFKTVKKQNLLTNIFRPTHSCLVETLL